MHLGGFLYGPVVAYASDQRSHLRVGPHECEVVAVEDRPHPASCVVPAPGAVVVVQQGVQCQGQVPVRCLPGVIEAARRRVGLKHRPEDFNADAVAKKLAGREEVSPRVHPIALRLCRLVAGRDAFARHDVERLPRRQLLCKCLPDGRTVVVLGSRRAVAPDPLVSATLPRLRSGLYPPLVDDRVELLAHPSGLGLLFDLVAVDHPATIAVRTVPVATRHSAWRLIVTGGDDLERADTPGRSGAVTEPRFQANSGPVGRRAPVGRQRN